MAPDKEEEVLGEVGSAASGMNLDQWRQKRDSLQTIVNKSSGISAMLEPSQLAESTKAKAKQADKRELARMVDSISMEIQKQDPQLQLLECHYMVASMTENAKERDRSMSYLRDYLARDDSEYKLQAAWYLQRLEQAE